jgi:hypothetical protein
MDGVSTSGPGLAPHRSDAILISLHNASLIFEILGPQSMEDLMEEMAESQLSSSPPIPLTPFLFALHLPPWPSVICQSDTSSISQANLQDNSYGAARTLAGHMFGRTLVDLNAPRPPLVQVCGQTLSLVQGRRLERERSLLCQQRGRGTRSKCCAVTQPEMRKPEHWQARPGQGRQGSDLQPHLHRALLLSLTNQTDVFRTPSLPSQ